MSRAFVKEDDHEDIPFVAPRADLPPGTPNYVTPKGLDELHAEKAELIKQREAVQSNNEGEKRVEKTVINKKLEQLENRISSAKVIKPEDQNQDEVRFGAIVTLKDIQGGNTMKYQIVGVDEANIRNGKIAFTSPLVKVLTNKKAGEKAVLKLPHITKEFKVLEILYR
jgi:transcription elongation factor GreB